MTGWPEARAFANIKSETIAKFINEEIITRYGCVEKIVVDGGSENKQAVEELCAKMNIKRHVITPYHLQANGMIKRGHKTLVDALAILYEEKPQEWPEHLHSVLWADRVTIRQSTGYSPYQLMYGQQCVLPIELGAWTWAALQWDKVRTTPELLAIRA